MNDGYLAVMMIVSAAILLATGWSVSLFGAKPGVSLAVVAALALVLSPCTVSVGPVTVSIGALPPVLYASWRLVGARPVVQALWLQLAAMVLLCVWLWVERYEAFHPSVHLVRESWDGALAGGLLASILVRGWQRQAAVIVVAAAAAGYFAEQSGTGDEVLYGWAWLDSLAIALIAGRLGSASGLAVSACVGKLRRGSFRMGEESGDNGP